MRKKKGFLENWRNRRAVEYDFPHRRSSNKDNSAVVLPRHFTAPRDGPLRAASFLSREEWDPAHGGQTNFRDRSFDSIHTRLSTWQYRYIAYVYCRNLIPKLWPLSLPCLRNFCDITVFYNYLRAWKENNGNYRATCHTRRGDANTEIRDHALLIFSYRVYII